MFEIIDIFQKAAAKLAIIECIFKTDLPGGKEQINNLVVLCKLFSIHLEAQKISIFKSDNHKYCTRIPVF
jgi:hypothetical protein